MRPHPIIRPVLKKFPRPNALPLAAAVLLTALLGGCASTIAGFAVEAAYTATGTRTVTEVVTDKKIELALRERFFSKDLGLFADVGAVVYRRRVLLTGDVADTAAKLRAGHLAAEPAGIVEVINEIQVADGDGIAGFIGDTVIETTIQSTLLFRDNVGSANYRIRSVNGVVYLIGQARSRAELDRVIEVVRRVKNVRRVVSHVRVAGA